jgi:predicted amidophosphoribosyltransferase
MDHPICPACKAENDEAAVYCDQCGQHLSPAAINASSEADAGGCPACGDVVENRGGGKGVCRGCGLELFETAGEAPPVKADAGAIERLTAAILKKTGAGVPLATAVAEGCREVFADSAEAHADDANESSQTHPCPLCGADCSEEAPRCVGCGIWFHGFRTPQPCPRCERPVT